MIEIISGSNRANANSLRIARVLLESYKDLGLEADLLNLQELPANLLDPGAYGDKPLAFAPFQERVLAASGLHVVTPEYNGGFPGALKLFIDMLAFPESFESKPVAYVGVASGQWGGLRAVEQLQMIFGYRNAYSYPRRVFIAGVHNTFTADGTFNDPELLRRLREQAAGFQAFVAQLS
ncbi:MAG: NAD(P)H-dependent oxidoreductase [Cyanobacteria bacterium K_Offshore_surface_m2_239]|nr:NAD(P)H-dependent oxidoreductase [Cyanobacteria bacterium K_Offshore_surface_m2_239]